MDDLTHRPAALRGGCVQGEAEPPPSFLHEAPLYRVFKGVQTAFRHRALHQMRAEGIDSHFGTESFGHTK